MKTAMPLIICGCPGSGTSLLAKMLRYCGIFLGDDAGPITNRKFHESAAFSEINQTWLEDLIQFRHAPKGLHQFRKLEKIRNSAIKKIIRTLDLDSLLDSFWGKQSRDIPWGWKDPRNSATAWIWKMIFPTATIVVLKRDWTVEFATQPSNSLAGRWFRELSTPEVRNYYQNPLRVPNTQCAKIEFEKLLQDETALNSFLDQVGLKPYQIGNFKQFSSSVGIENRLNEED